MFEKLLNLVPFPLATNFVRNVGLRPEARRLGRHFPPIWRVGKPALR